MENEPTGFPANALEMVLYVNPATGISAKARRNLDAALKGCDPSTYRLTVRDVSQDLAEAEADHVVFTPMLIVRHPETSCTLVGDLADLGLVTALLSLGALETSG